MTSAQREPIITGVCGRVPRSSSWHWHLADPLVVDQGLPLKLKAFCPFSYKRGAKSYGFRLSDSSVYEVDCFLQLWTPPIHV